MFKTFRHSGENEDTEEVIIEYESNHTTRGGLLQSPRRAPERLTTIHSTREIEGVPFSRI